MKSKNPYSIVNRPAEFTSLRKTAENMVSTALKKQSRTLVMDRVPPGLLEALVSSSNQVLSPTVTKTAKRRVVKAALPAAADLSSEVLKVVERAASGSIASTVGILDLGAWVSRLPDLLKVMNKSQDALVFLEVQTPVPAGLIKTEEPLARWAEKLLGRSLKEEESKDLKRNMLADEFYFFGESVRKQNKLDVLVALTPAMIAFEEKGAPRWNYFAAGNGDVSVVSTCDVREFSTKAGRPYEAAIGMLIAAQVLASRNNMEYHEETRGCIFDFNDERTELVESIRGMHIDADCMKHFKDKDEAKNAKSLVTALARMKETHRG
ncbi:hypothetical protein IB236_03550 [Acidovorax sp. ACV02]|uniref:hypothetical protein n=1 Tax=Acidovorax sp. ACV02 TaxID=2769310 RepID=UPI001780A31B|nr:hypothetical protein [Acidovorax sp. ACV02]MBD9404390.1 hypothetical protein [Acidovorax sp. ACV02]